jgi:hypothetical protein
MTEPKALPGWLVVDHEIPGVTPDMIDWWWVNMEKGYPLWCPDEHKGFVWEVPPPVGGHIGAIQIAKESIDYGPVRDIRIAWLDPNSAPQEVKDWLVYKHALVAGGLAPGASTPMAYLTHQYEEASYGTKMRSTMHLPSGQNVGGPPPGSPPSPPPAHPSGKKPTGGGWIAHNKAEVGTFENFLPSLYQIWQAVDDPAVNHQCSLKIKKEGSKITYVK